jgi:hypothetical protein
MNEVMNLLFLLHYYFVFALLYASVFLSCPCSLRYLKKVLRTSARNEIKKTIRHHPARAGRCLIEILGIVVVSDQSSLKCLKTSKDFAGIVMPVYLPAMPGLVSGQSSLKCLKGI